MNLLDRLLASADERSEAFLKARKAHREHGEGAEAELRRKLANPIRGRSRRVLRLAIAEVRRRTSST